MRASGRDRPFLAGRAGPRAGARPLLGRSPGERFSYKSLVVQHTNGHGLLSGDRSTRRLSRIRSKVERRPRGGARARRIGGAADRGRGGSGARRIGGAADRRRGVAERGRGGTGAFSAEEGRLRPRHVSIWQSGDGQIGRPRVPCSVRVSSRTCGDVWFRQGPDTGEREPRTPLGLVKKVAKRSTWQPPVDSRPRCLGSKVSVEATSASWVVEASLSEAAIRTSVT